MTLWRGASRCVFIVLSVLVPGSRCHKGLFFNQPHVLDMNPTDFEAQVVNDTSGCAWVAALYASWCGHCQHYAPQFVKHAEAFVGNPHVRFAAVDCSQYDDYCFYSLDVHGYPNVRGFHFPAGDDLRGNASALEKAAKVGQTVDREVEAWVRKHLAIVNATTTPLRVTPPAANLRDRFVKGRTPSPSPKARESFNTTREKRKAAAAARVAAIGDGGLASARAAPARVPEDVGTADEELGQAGLHLVDAEVAVLYSLHQGTFLKGEAVAGRDVKAFIHGEVLAELCAWLEFLAEALPSARASADLEVFLRVARAAQALGGLSAVAWDEVLDRRGLDRLPPQAGKDPEQHWRICTTYTCGLWTLFHILTLSLAQGRVRLDLKPASAQGLRGSADGWRGREDRTPLALRRIRGFVDNFFGCGECAAHFLETVDSCAFGRCSLSEGDHVGAAVWLSTVHNSVAKRVARETDPCQSASCSFGCLDSAGSCSSFEGRGIAKVHWDDPASAASGSALASCSNQTACGSRGFRVFADGEAPGSWPPRALCPGCWAAGVNGGAGSPAQNGEAVYDQLVASYWRREWVPDAPRSDARRLGAAYAVLTCGVLAALLAMRVRRMRFLRETVKCS